jgi:hypothetical protein
MPIQSIRRTPLPGKQADVDDLTYREKWAELRLQTVAENVVPDPKQAITISVIDSGVPEDQLPKVAPKPPKRKPKPGQRPKAPAGPRAPSRRDRDDDGHSINLAKTITGDRKPRRNVKLASRKFFDAQGWPRPDCATEVINKAAADSPKVIVLAWDVGHTVNDLRDAILNMRETAVVVVAAGNWSLDIDRHPNWPASYGADPEMDHVITVMATDEHDERASYSSYGKRTVFVGAPGTSMVDATTSPSSALRKFGSLRDSRTAFRGTSAATAHVARLAALVIAKNPNWSPQRVKRHIGATARKVAALKGFCATGGVIDFEVALK